MALAAYQFTVVDDAGNVQPNASVAVLREIIGSPPAVLFEDRDGVTPLGNPFNAGVDGFARFFVAGGAFRITATLGAFSKTWRYVAIGTATEADVEDFMPASGTTGFIDFPEIATPASPAANVARLYAKDSGGITRLFRKDSSGIEIQIGSNMGLVDAGLYGLVSDAVRVAVTASITSGAAALTATGATFTAADVGKLIAVPGAGAAGATLISTILAFTDATHVTLANNAGTTLSAVAKTIAYGTNNAAAMQAALDAVPTDGGTLHIPPGDYVVGSTITRTLNAGGVLGWGIEIVGGGWGNTTIYPIMAASTHAMVIFGPSGTFSSNFVIRDLQFRSGVDWECHGLALTGAVNAKVSCFFNRCNVGLQVEAVLISMLDSIWYQNVIGLDLRKTGFFGGAWGSSGCNANKIRGDFRENLQYGLIADTFQGIDIQAHFERNGDEDVAGGGVSNTDRGGMRFNDPEGRMRLECSFEDNGDVEGANEGKGCVSVITSALNAGIQWALVLDGCQFQRTADGPKSILYVDQHASAGSGHIVWQGSILQNLPSYTPSSANPIFNLVATGQNLECHMFGGKIEAASTEWSFSNDVKYNIFGLSECTPSQKSEAYIRNIGSDSVDLTLHTTANGGGNILGNLIYAGRDSAGNDQEYVKVRAYISDNTSTLEDGVLQILAMMNGSFAEVAAIGPGILSSQPLGGIGYSVGAGGSVTQATSKTTGVTLDKICGQVVMATGNLAAGANAVFTLTNGTITAHDEIDVWVKSGGTANAYNANVVAVAAGSCAIRLTNVTAGALNEAGVVVGFSVKKCVIS